MAAMAEAWESAVPTTSMRPACVISSRSISATGAESSVISTLNGRRLASRDIVVVLPRLVAPPRGTVSAL